MAQQRRVHKIAERVRGLVATELLHMNDPRLMLVTITSVVLSSDLKHAKIYWNVSGDKSRIAEAERAFSGSAGHFRRVLSKELQLRTAPEIRFYYDDTLDTFEQVEQLMAQIATVPKSAD